MSLVWFITGTSSGFGRLFAETAARRGHHVAATARSLAAAERVCAVAPERMLPLALDVTSPEQVSAAVDGAVERFGRLDVVVNNAGYGVVGAWEEVPGPVLRAQFDTNLFGAVEVIRAVLPVLRAQGSGQIVTMSSIAGVSASPGLGTYAATKHAVEGLSASLAVEVAPFGIGVTVIEPGAFRTSWAGRSMTVADELPAYAAGPTHRLRQALQGLDGQQAGDPQRAADILVDLAESGRWPARLPLGSDAVAGLRAAAARLSDDADRWSDLARSAEFDA